MINFKNHLFFFRFFPHFVSAIPNNIFQCGNRDYLSFVLSFVTLMCYSFHSLKFYIFGLFSILIYIFGHSVNHIMCHGKL